jgi:1,4-alpha-glucan branching enzyme
MLFQKFKYEDLNELSKRILQQAYKELLLAQSSDWQFLIYTESAKDYAEMRFSNHHSDFNKLCDLVETAQISGNIDEAEIRYLEETEIRDNIFEELDIKWWADLEF